MRKILLFFLPFLWAASASAQLSGTYTINANSEDERNYVSFSAATSALSAGVSGEVIFEVAPGTYEEYVTVNAITGASSSNRVIFRGMGDDNQQVVITSNAGYTDNYTLKLNGVDFVTFENMTLTTTSTNKAILLKLTGDVDNDRFDNVRFIGVEVASSSTDNDKHLVHMESGSDRDDNAFVGCQFINGCVALYLQGNNATSFNNGVLVENCYFINQQFKSIYLSFYNDVVVRGNTIINANDYKVDYNAIDANQCYNACVFENNVMNITRTTNYATVVKLRPCVGTEENHVLFRNNIINLNSAASNDSYCLSIDNNANTVRSSYIDVAHNTFKCTGTGKNTNVVVLRKIQHIFLYNNLLINESQTGYVIRFNTATEERYSDFNRIAYTCDNFALRSGTDYATLQDWTEATSLDANSALCTPQFVSTQDLHLTESEGLTVANPLSYVTTDIDGEARSETPCAGADEMVVEQDLPPVVANPIAPVVFTAFPQTLSFDLEGVFDDPDNDNSLMEYEATARGTAVSVNIDDSGFLVIVRNTADTFTDTVVVTATSNNQTVDMLVPVSGSEVTMEIGIADFEDVELSEQGYWMSEEEGNSLMFSHGWSFSSFYSSDYGGYWNGFTASNRTDTTQNGMDAQYTAITGGGYDTSSNYAVAYVYGMITVMAADSLAHTVTGCYVTNNLWTYKDMRDGGYGYAPFGGTDGTTPDYLVLHAIGKDVNDNVIDTLDFFLADYRFENSDSDYMVDTWEWFDLSSLGAVASISFTMESTIGNEYGMLTPSYFCMDNFNGVAPSTPHEDMPPYIANPVADWVSSVFPDSVTISLSGVAADDDSPADSIVYSLLTNSNETAVMARVADNALTITRLVETADTATLTLRATSGELYVDFTVNVVLHPVTVVRDYAVTVSLYPNPTGGQFTINVPNANNFDYALFNAIGQEVLRGKSAGESASLNVSDLNKGIYYVTITYDGKRITNKLLVK